VNNANVLYHCETNLEMSNDYINKLEGTLSISKIISRYSYYTGHNTEIPPNQATWRSFKI